MNAQSESTVIAPLFLKLWS